MTDEAFIARWAPTLPRHRETLTHETQQQESADVAPAPEAPARTGVMIAFFIDDDAASELALDGGEAPGELHLTLAFLGEAGVDLSGEDETKLVAVVADWAADTEPLTANIAGIGFFNNTPPVTYASIDSPALPALRQDLVEALTAAGYPPKTDHGFTPHVTLAYDDRRDVRVQPAPLTFSDVVVAFAGARTTIALNGTAKTESAHLSITDRPTGPVAALIDVPEPAKAFVSDVGGRTLITGPATTAAFKDPTVEDIAEAHMLWMSGKFVGAEVPNRNGALWSAGDLEMSAASITHGPLNWLHESRHVIGTLADAQYINASTNTGPQHAAETIHPHITATAAIWKWIWPDEAYVVQQASDMGQLWYSMECISKEVACTGPGGCGNTTTYSQYMAGAACAHVTQRASIRQFINPVFLGGAVIVPPTRPGWAEADATVMTQAAAMAETAFEQAGEPDVKASDWEQMMAQLIRFGGR